MFPLNLWGRVSSGEEGDGKFDFEFTSGQEGGGREKQFHWKNKREKTFEFGEVGAKTYFEEIFVDILW